MLRYNYTTPNMTFHDSRNIDVWQYPGNGYMTILKRPERVNVNLMELTMVSRARPFDKMVEIPYGHCWESPGYINALMCLNRPINKERLDNFAVQNDASIWYLSAEEYVRDYQSVYEKYFPGGVAMCHPDFDYHTVKRLRHLLYFKRDQLSVREYKFCTGIGKIIGAGQEISEKQRTWVRDILLRYGNNEANILDGPYITVGDYKHPF